jgi:hypothetical protein
VNRSVLAAVYAIVAIVVYGVYAIAVYSLGHDDNVVEARPVTVVIVQPEYIIVDRSVIDEAVVNGQRVINNYLNFFENVFRVGVIFIVGIFIIIIGIFIFAEYNRRKSAKADARKQQQTEKETPQ